MAAGSSTKLLSLAAIRELSADSLVAKQAKLAYYKNHIFHVSGRSVVHSELTEAELDKVLALGAESIFLLEAALIAKNLFEQLRELNLADNQAVEGWLRAVALSNNTILSFVETLYPEKEDKKFEQDAIVGFWSRISLGSFSVAELSGLSTKLEKIENKHLKRFNFSDDDYLQVAYACGCIQNGFVSFVRAQYPFMCGYLISAFKVNHLNDSDAELQKARAKAALLIMQSFDEANLEKRRQLYQDYQKAKKDYPQFNKFLGSGIYGDFLEGVFREEFNVEFVQSILEFIRDAANKKITRPAELANYVTAKIVEKIEACATVEARIALRDAYRRERDARGSPLKELLGEGNDRLIERRFVEGMLAEEASEVAGSAAVFAESLSADEAYFREQAVLSMRAEYTATPEQHFNGILGRALQLQHQDLPLAVWQEIHAGRERVSRALGGKTLEQLARDFAVVDRAGKHYRIANTAKDVLKILLASMTNILGVYRRLLLEEDRRPEGERDPSGFRLKPWVMQAIRETCGDRFKAKMGEARLFLLTLLADASEENLAKVVKQKFLDFDVGNAGSRIRSLIAKLQAHRPDLTDREVAMQDLLRNIDSALTAEEKNLLEILSEHSIASALISGAAPARAFAVDVFKYSQPDLSAHVFEGFLQVYLSASDIANDLDYAASETVFLAQRQRFVHTKMFEKFTNDLEVSLEQAGSNFEMGLARVRDEYAAAGEYSRVFAALAGRAHEIRDSILYTKMLSALRYIGEEKLFALFENFDSFTKALIDNVDARLIAEVLIAIQNRHAANPSEALPKFTAFLQERTAEISAPALYAVAEQYSDTVIAAMRRAKTGAEVVKIFTEYANEFELARNSYVKQMMSMPVAQDLHLAVVDFAMARARQLESAARGSSMRYNRGTAIKVAKSVADITLLIDKLRKVYSVSAVGEPERLVESATGRLVPASVIDDESPFVASAAAGAAAIGFEGEHLPSLTPRSIIAISAAHMAEPSVKPKRGGVSITQAALERSVDSLAQPVPRHVIDRRIGELGLARFSEKTTRVDLETSTHPLILDLRDVEQYNLSAAINRETRTLQLSTSSFLVDADRGALGSCCLEFFRSKGHFVEQDANPEAALKAFIREAHTAFAELTPPVAPGGTTDPLHMTQHMYSSMVNPVSSVLDSMGLNINFPNNIARQVEFATDGTRSLRYRLSVKRAKIASPPTESDRVIDARFDGLEIPFDATISYTVKFNDAKGVYELDKDSVVVSGYDQDFVTAILAQGQLSRQQKDQLIKRANDCQIKALAIESIVDHLRDFKNALTQYTQPEIHKEVPNREVLRLLADLLLYVDQFISQAKALIDEYQYKKAMGILSAEDLAVFNRKVFAKFNSFVRNMPAELSGDLAREFKIVSLLREQGLLSVDNDLATSVSAQQVQRIMMTYLSKAKTSGEVASILNDYLTVLTTPGSAVNSVMRGHADINEAIVDSAVERSQKLVAVAPNPSVRSAAKPAYKAHAEVRELAGRAKSVFTPVAAVKTEAVSALGWGAWLCKQLTWDSGRSMGDWFLGWFGGGNNSRRSAASAVPVRPKVAAVMAASVSAASSVSVSMDHGGGPETRVLVTAAGGPSAP